MVSPELRSFFSKYFEVTRNDAIFARTYFQCKFENNAFAF